jgi:hypothetical protein
MANYCRAVIKSLRGTTLYSVQKGLIIRLWNPFKDQLSRSCWKQGFHRSLLYLNNELCDFHVQISNPRLVTVEHNAETSITN